jgi:ferredoxin-NADP reductase
MLRTLADRGDKRPLTLFYANKTLDQAAFRDELEHLKSRLNLSVLEVPEKAPEGWQGPSGFINRALLEKNLPIERKRDAFEIFICGPKPMMDAVETALEKLGVFSGDYHSERFDLV